MPQNDRPIPILLIEDNIGDVRLIQEVFRESKYNVQLHAVNDGEEAIHFLKHQPPHQNAPRPSLIFLDLNLPKKDGREVLSEIKSNGDLCSIPVVVFSSSEADKDVNRSYELNANCYVVKPFDFSEFSEAVERIQHFWLGLVKLPNDYDS